MKLFGIGVGAMTLGGLTGCMRLVELPQDPTSRIKEAAKRLNPKLLREIEDKFIQDRLGLLLIGLGYIFNED